MSNLTIQLRGGFNDRNKMNPLSTEMQLKNLNSRTRNKIANLIKQWFEVIQKRNLSRHFCASILNDVFGLFLSEELENRIEYNSNAFVSEYIFDPILCSPYNDVFTLVEYISKYISILRNDFFKSPYHYSCNCPFPNTTKGINNLFEAEFVGYRMIDGEITPITDNLELTEIQMSLDMQFEGCRSHIRKALNLLSDRENPDYKNSIKESISAVESICHIICRDKKATLGKALNQLEENGIKVHKALKEAFCKLYGYASDEGGIRHAEGMFESNVSFEDSKYFLVSCCAFVNYLIGVFGGIADGNNE